MNEVTEPRSWPHDVIPAKAGIQESGWAWTPAFAGVTRSLWT